MVCVEVPYSGMTRRPVVSESNHVSETHRVHVVLEFHPSVTNNLDPIRRPYLRVVKRTYSVDLGTDCQNIPSL